MLFSCFKIIFIFKIFKKKNEFKINLKYIIWKKNLKIYFPFLFSLNYELGGKKTRKHFEFLGFN